MALPTSGTISIYNIKNEFGGSGSHGLFEYYRLGNYVDNSDSNTNVPTRGQISIYDFYGTRNLVTYQYDVPALDNNSFHKSTNRHYRRLSYFSNYSNGVVSGRMKGKIRGDEREPSKWNKWNGMTSKNPWLDIRRGGSWGTTWNNWTTSAPPGTSVALGKSTAKSEGDNAWSAFDITATSDGNAGTGTFHVVASVHLERFNGSAAPGNQWQNDAFKIYVKTT